VESGASVNPIGGASVVDVSGRLSGAGNLISGNLHSGVQLNQATNNVLQGNFIGTNVTGKVALGNDPTFAFDDVDLFSASSNTLGGASSLDANGNLSGLGNLISGEKGSTSGLWITNSLADFATPGGASSNNLVQG